MKRHSRNRIKLDWVKDAAFDVRVNRVIPKARRAPEMPMDFFLPPDEEAWRAPSFLF